MSSIHKRAERLLASAARTATVSSEQYDGDCIGGQFIIDVTAVTATPSITARVEGYDPVSGKYYPILVSAAITTVSTNVITVFPGLAAVANVVADNFLPEVWRVTVTHGDADSITYSVSANLTDG